MIIKRLREIELRTRLRRAQDRISSVSLGSEYEYGSPQLQKKSSSNLFKDFGISTESLSTECQGIVCYGEIERKLNKPGLCVHRNGTMNRQEPAIIFGDPQTRTIVAFENNPLYQKKSFRSAYKIDPSAFEEFIKTGNVGLHPIERKQLIANISENKASLEKQRLMKSQFFKQLPKDARLNNKQIREGKQVRETKTPGDLTPKEEKIIKRLEKFEKSQRQFEIDNFFKLDL